MWGAAEAPLPQSHARPGAVVQRFLLFCRAFPPPAGPAWLPPFSPPEPLRRQRCARPSSSPCLSPLRSLQAPSLTSGSHSCLIFLLSCRISTTPITLSLGTTSVSLKAVEGSPALQPRRETRRSNSCSKPICPKWKVAAMLRKEEAWGKAAICLTARFKLLLSGELAALKTRMSHLSGEDGVMWKCRLRDTSSKPWRRHACRHTQS